MKQKKVFRRIAFRFLPLAFFVFLLGGVFARPEPLLVLLYHRVDDGPLNAVPSVTPREFARQVAYLHRAGYQSITPTELYAHLYRGRSLPPRSVLFTFDDGWESVYTNARPILAAYGYTATVFMVTGRLGRPGYLTAAQLRRLAAEGWEIGAHTVTHPHLPDLDSQAASREIEGSRTALARILGRPVESFAYPYGDLDPRIRTLVQKAGFKMAFGTRLGAPEGTSDLYCLERLTIPRRGGLFLLRFATAAPFNLDRRNLARLAKTTGFVKIQTAYSRRLGRTRRLRWPLRFPLL
ncbi:MAG: polysaccharide deacetylase family protein [Bacillota bacterium]